MKQIFEIETETGIDEADLLKCIVSCARESMFHAVEPLKSIISVREILPKTPAEEEAEMEKVLSNWMAKHREKAVIACQSDCICWDVERLLDKIMIAKFAPDWKRRGEKCR